MTFESSINLGNLLTIVSGIVMLSLAWSKLGARLTMLEYRATVMENALKDIGVALKSLVTQEKDILAMKMEIAGLLTAQAVLTERVEGLARGEGFIQAPRRGNVDGEYSRPG